MMSQNRRGERADLVDTDGKVIASARCRYSESVSRVGMRSWRGQLTELEPEYGLTPDAFELRFEDGRCGSVIVNRVNFSSGRRTTATFVGNGSSPSKN